jgi:hypothetical protein
MQQHRRGMAGTLRRAGLALLAVAFTSVAASAQAGGRPQERTINFDNVPVTAPNGQQFVVSGQLPVRFHVTRDRAGGVHVTAHAKPEGLRIAQVGGPTYTLRGVANFTTNVGVLKGSATEFNGVLNGRLAGSGSARDTRVHVNIHGTMNANGDITAAHGNIVFPGRG